MQEIFCLSFLESNSRLGNINVTKALNVIALILCNNASMQHWCLNSHVEMHARRGLHWHNLDINIISFKWSIEYKLQARSEKLYMLLWRKINIHSNIYIFKMFTDCDNLFSCYFGFVALNILMFTSALCLTQKTVSLLSDQTLRGRENRIRRSFTFHIFLD